MTLPSEANGKAPGGPPGSGIRSWGRLWGLAFVVATLLGIWTTLFVYVGMRSMGKPLPLRTAALAGLPDWYFWAALTPLVFWLGLRVRLDRRHWPRAILIHLAAGLVVVLAELLVFTMFNHRFYYNPWAPAPTQFWDAYVQNLLRFFHFAFLIYSVIVAAAHAWSFARQNRARELEAAELSRVNAELEAKLSQARLDALRAQLNPHFVFNALNTVSGLVRDRRGEEATELVARLGQFLRRSLRATAAEESTLREELDLVDEYVMVERARFRERLEVSYDVASEVLSDRVPTMILQPLVENAIRHGLRDAPAGHLGIAARADHGDLYLEVSDNGRGLASPGPSLGEGLGLANTRARLDRLYRGAYRLEIVAAEPSGVRVSIRVPRHLARSGAATEVIAP